MGFGGTGWATPVGQIDVDGARRQIGLARDAGVNLIDTADVYSNGLAEEIVGQALGKSRDDVLVATKVRMPMGDGPNDAGLSRHHIIRGRGQPSAAGHRLHRPLPGARVGRAHAAGGDARRARRRWCSSGQGALRRRLQLHRLAADEGARRRRPPWPPRFVSQQIYYSLQAREAENELVPLTIDQGLGILVWSPLAGGLLSGKYRRGVEAPAGQPAPHRVGRAAGPRRGQALRHHRGAGRRSPRRTVSPRRRWRWPI